MKELSIEDKAKAYDEAIEYGRYLINECCKEGTNGSFHRADLDKMFPELKESEDERIRKELLNNLKEASYGKTLVVSTLDYKRWADWLKKQGDKDEEILVLKDQIESLHAAIKALKEAHKIELEKQGKQKPAEWHREDEPNLNACLGYTINNLTELKDRYGEGYGNVGKCINWLKSLGPQNT